MQTRLLRRRRGGGGSQEEQEVKEEEDVQTDEEQHEYHLLGDGKVYLVLLFTILLCGGLVLSNIFLPAARLRAERAAEEGQEAEQQQQQQYLHPTVKARALDGGDLEMINSKINRVKRLPDSPDPK